MNLKDLFGLDGKIALVTGGSRGIGKMIVEGLLEAGCAKVYIAARKQEQVDATCAELGDKVIGLTADLSQLDGIKQLAGEIASREDKLDLLVNNAGAAWGEPFAEFSEAGWDRTMDLNVKGPFFLTQQLHKLLKAAGTVERPAKVLMIASIDGMKTNPWETYPYQASKAGLIHLTRRMAAELVRDNIIVNGIGPGAFPSAMNRAARDNEALVAKGIPSKRVGVTEDMAAGAIYLLSRAGDYVVGTTIPIDGGVVNANIGAGNFVDPSGE
ncbi:SDR family NAD(P)-dependent oxidoreductase [Parerythrobacter jejuensis]|uniref:SDR family NAD(P)-dependent oxidoreductase n=1 Tax=Parerythrobacter jejuensis TaxID=795812 RepID=A0A845AN24_9SPHN|nr:SDR family NAD(P)-dependent oxidoreductase [Parerythrobacter jejuensis]MXP30295.1 SDR family NAD(P)-dependent oxidoreductase [Parerythrobacter jejuensis]MXP33055.1 SDR family NAD(P)-dependent oxidoreductase [Parerythrobacter jejuensis]